MNKIASILFFTLTASVAQADIIYTNLNPTTPFDTSNGNFVSSGGIDYGLSFSFNVTGHNYLVDSISFGAFLSSSPNAITATIYADDGSGKPGTVLFLGSEIDNQLAAQGAVNTNDQDLVTQAVNQSVLLLAGNTYWLGLDSVSPDSNITWGYNGSGTIGPAALLLSGNWTSTSREQGAFQIDGTIAAPEPVSTGLLASGLSALFLFRHRLKRSN